MLDSSSERVGEGEEEEEEEEKEEEEEEKEEEEEEEFIDELALEVIDKSLDTPSPAPQVPLRQLMSAPFPTNL